MIDEKKIERTANLVFEGIDNNPSIEKDAFILGAQWAQEELVKSLWHDVSEEPKDDIDILVLTPSWCNLIYHSSTINWALFTKRNNIEKWCYVDDILPKKDMNNE